MLLFLLISVFFYSHITIASLAPAGTGINLAYLTSLSHDQRLLRMHFKGDTNKYLIAFHKAAQAKNAVLQVALVDAYTASVIADDKSISEENKNILKYYDRVSAVAMLIDCYEVIQVASQLSHATNRQIYKVFKQAARQEYPLAQLVKAGFSKNKDKYRNQWKKPEKLITTLKSIALTKNPDALYLYGKALVRSKKIRDGFKNMSASGLLTVHEIDNSLLKGYEKVYKIPSYEFNDIKILFGSRGASQEAVYCESLQDFKKALA